MSVGHGIRHMQFTTKDLPATREFWHGALGFPIVLQDHVPAGDGHSLARDIYAVGNGSYVIFLDIADHPGFSERVDTSLYGGLNRPSMSYHFAFDVGSVDQLEAKYQYLKSRDVAMSEISWMIDWSAQFYFPDPVNSIQLEYTSIRFIPGRERDLSRRFRESTQEHWLDYLKIANAVDPEMQPELEAEAGAPIDAAAVLSATHS